MPSPDPLPSQPERHSLVRLARTIPLDGGFRKARRRLDLHAGEALLQIGAATARSDAEALRDVDELIEAAHLATQILGQRWQQKLATQILLPTPLADLNSRFD